MRSPDDSLALLDDVAERTVATGSLGDLQRLFAMPGLAVPARATCLSPAVGPREVALGH